MIAFNSIHQTAFTASLFHKSRVSSRKKRSSTPCLCKSTEPDPDSPKEDTQKQELLARIAQLQTQKVRLGDYLDERSDFLTQFAEEADADFDKIGEDALKELDEAGNRIMENIRSQMEEFEESAEQNRLEIEESENKLAELQDQIVKDRNEGLFFQNLREETPTDKAMAKEEAKKIEEVAKRIAASKTRRNIYFGLIGILVISIADSFVSSTADWRKIGVLGGILVGLFTQVVYEQSILSEKEETEK